jgi:two-component sensor histidine kinase/CHASE1-domain containing sensor protein
MGLLRAIKDNYLAAPLIVLAVGVLASAAGAFQVARTAVAKDQERFDHSVAQAQDSIAARLDTYMAMLRAGSGLMAAEGGVVDRESFHRFVEQLQIPTHYPGIQGIGFSARLAGHDAAAAQAGLAAYGVTGFAVYPSGQRDEIHAIVHLEPMDRRNQAALGYDMSSEPVRRAAMARARDTGRPAASGRVQLVEEIDQAKQAGFLIYMPVYRGGAIPRTLEARREALLGFVYSPFRADDLMRGIFGSTEPPRLNVDIYDGAVAPANLLHSSPGGRAEPSSFSAMRTLDVAGRRWTLDYSTRPEFDQSSNRVFAPIILLGGLLATGVIAGAAWSQGRARRRADRAAAQSEAHARELEILHQASGRLAAELDRDRLVQDVTDAGRELAGAEIGAFFYNLTDKEGESYQLFALSGAPREAFANMGMPRNTAIFGPTFRGERPVRVDDITQDPRYGRNAPRQGLPPGHWPVRSYLAAPVVSRTGAVLGGLFFGHSRPGVFTEQSERSVVALAGHAAIAIDNASLFQAAQDEIAARRAVEEHQKLLLGELNHRVKNTLATIQSIAAQTLRSSADLAEFQEAFEARLVALSEAHNLLSRENWRGVTLDDLVRRELTPHGLGDGDRMAVTGPAVWLPPSAAVALGMAIHELATNAARHGALSSTSGRVSVSWSVATSGPWPRLTLVWQESGGPPVQPPQRRGFGSRMIERGLRHDLQGEAKLHFEATGLRCVIEAPLPAALEAA